MHLYRFARAEPGGMLGTRFTALQFLLFGVAAMGGLAIFNNIGGMPGLITTFVLVAVMIGLTAAPIYGRPPVEWLPILVASARRPSVWFNATGQAGHTMLTPEAFADVEPPEPELPPSAEGIELLTLELGEGQSIGVIADRRAGTYSCVLDIRVAAYALLGEDAHAQLVASWGQVLAFAARENTPIHRLQWIEGTGATDVHDLANYFNDTRDRSIPLDDARMQSYIQTLNNAPSATRDHDIRLVVQIDARKSSREIKHLSRGKGLDAGACQLLLEQIRTLKAGLEACGLVVNGALRTRSIARMIREAYDPASREDLMQLGGINPLIAGTSPDTAWPEATEEEWSIYRTDSAYHATLRIAEWPRDDVGPTFLAPLLLESAMLRRISVVMEPVPPSEARRETRYAKTSARGNRRMRVRDENDEDVQRDLDLTMREQELNRGAGMYRFAGYVTVSALNRHDLQQSIYDVTQLAARAGSLQLRMEFGRQSEAFTYTLPFGRGL